MSVRGLTGLFLGLAALLIVAGAAAGPPPVPGEQAALAAVRHAVAAGWLDRAAANEDRHEIARAAGLARRLPPDRRVHVEAALEEIGALGKGLTQQRALAVFGQLRVNDDYFAHHTAPSGGTDIADADGIVYRYFAGRCFEFHPLANFSALNARVAAKDVAGTERLAAALVARGVSRRGGGTVWEYYFSFGGRPPWVSGMAQAVAAQAFARAASLVTDQSAALMREAGGAFRAVPRLTTNVAAGPWIRLYSFSSNPVLNAQLQSVLSLQAYATAADDSAAATLAGQMQQAAAATVSHFDTGYWTSYSLRGNPSPLSYQKYVVQLLHKLAPADPRFAQAAGRFAAYLRQPPAFKLADAPEGALRFWLSKPAAVSISTPAGRSLRLSLGAGWHTLGWREPRRPGFYPISVTAVDWAGNRASFEALPIVRVPGAVHRSTRVRLTSGTVPAAGSVPLAAGIGIDDPSQAALAGALGFRLVSRTVAWQPGQTTPDASLIASLQGVPPGGGLVLELSAAQLPVDEAGRNELAQYAASLAGQTPSLRDLVLAPAPALATASAYADTLAVVRGAVAAVRTDVAVGPLFDGSAGQPQRTAQALARELARDGGGIGLVSFQPAPIPGAGVWAAGDVNRLVATIAKALGTAPPVLLDTVAVPTLVPPSELGAYTGGAPSVEGAVSPATQASAYAEAVGAASCSPGVSGVLLDRLVDAPGPEPATGLFYANGDPKPSSAAVKQAIRSVARGAVVCPGLATRVTPTALTFPTQLSSTSAASVVLGCDRDCLYLATLDGADGRPVVARRGTLTGGDPATTITLPKRILRPGGYRLDVRLVSRVDPGSVLRRMSALLTAG